MGSEKQILNIEMIDDLNCKFNESTKILEILYDNTTLVSIPFEKSIGDPCYGCMFTDYCDKPIFGFSAVNFMYDICGDGEIPQDYRPDLDRLGVSAEKLYNIIKGRIIKKLPKPKEL